jgi:hypothetical protein
MEGAVESFGVGEELCAAFERIGVESGQACLALGGFERTPGRPDALGLGVRAFALAHACSRAEHFERIGDRLGRPGIKKAVI